MFWRHLRNMIDIENLSSFWCGLWTDVHRGHKTYFQSLPGLMELVEKMLAIIPQAEEKRKP